MWATNHLGPVLLTKLLLDAVKNSEQGRIITIASKGLKAKPFLKVDLEDPEFRKKKFSLVDAYYQSKRAQVMYTYWDVGLNMIVYTLSLTFSLNLSYGVKPDKAACGLL